MGKYQYGDDTMIKSNKLSVLKIKSIDKKGLYSDGYGLYLQVSKGLTKTWIVRYKSKEKAKSAYLGLGSLKAVSLAEARKKAIEIKRLLLEGKDPLAEKNKAKEELSKSKRHLFKDCAESYIKTHELEWKNKKHKYQWSQTLSTFAYPIMGHLPVNSIDTGIVLQALDPIWREKTETATRLRQRIEAVLDWAATRKMRDPLNPARWKGHLDKLLPKPSKIAQVKPLEALPIEDLPALISKLQERTCTAAKALEFLILTASRTSEVIGMRWEEISFAKELLVIPAKRMKAGREHIVPLSKRAIEILEEMKIFKSTSDYVFNGPTEGKHLSNMAMLVLLQKRMGYEKITVHGFRSTFRDWVSEYTNHQGEVAEMALAHTVRGVEGRYRRGKLLLKRKILMNDWERFTASPPKEGKLVQISRSPDLKLNAYNS